MEPRITSPEEMQTMINCEKDDHEETWNWLVAYVHEHKVLPSADEFFQKIVNDELREDPEFYEDEFEEQDIPLSARMGY
jgi:hypothetical protein